MFPSVRLHLLHIASRLLPPYHHHARWNSLAACYSIGLLVACSGCSCTPPPKTAGLPPSTAEVWLQMIEEGNTDEAADLLIQNPDMLNALNAPEAFTLTEEDFAWLSHSRRKDVQSEAVDAVNQIRTLTRAMMEKAALLEKDGDIQGAERYRKAVRNLGESLNTPDHLIVLQQTGAALQAISGQPPSNPDTQ